MGSRERQFECTNCGATVLVEFGTYSGGPLAYDDFAKCPACGKEYSDQAEIARLVGVRRARDKSLQSNTGGREPRAEAFTFPRARPSETIPR